MVEMGGRGMAVVLYNVIALHSTWVAWSSFNIGKNNKFSIDSQHILQ